MAITGELWTAFEQINSNNIRKWLYGTVLVRDWDPAGTTSLAGFTPFNNDGSLKTTLFDASNPGGPWFDLGALDANGVDFSPRYKTNDTDIWQSRLPQRTDVDGDGEDIDIVCAETNPVALALYNNQPLVDVPGTGANSVLQSVGTVNFTATYSITPQIIYRQLLILGVDGELSNPIYVAELRPRVSLTKLHKRMFNAKKPDDFGLSFGVYVDPASAYAKAAIYGGSAWLALGGTPAFATPNFIALKPPTVNTATIVPSTLAGAPSGTGGTFAAGAYFWTMTAKTAAGDSTRSNEISATLSGSTSSNVLTWSAVTGATGYKIYRGSTAGGEGTLVTTIGSGATVTYTDTGSAGSAGSPSVLNNATLPAPSSLGVTPSGSGGVLPAGTYYWEITGLTANGETLVSNEVTGTTTGTTSSAALTWSALTGATGYNVYRGVSVGGEKYLVGSVPSGATTSYTDAGTSVLATALAGSQVSLAWQQPASTNGPFTYAITQTTGGTTTASTIVTAPATATSGKVTAKVGSLTASNVYTFTITATAADGQSASYPASNSITAT